ncbi:MAG TPA: response regulator transcription factor [Solirubrobacteraceae bacterium]|nr:response regulator transcription factor [Solirubrobacteraceae bacterium]
MALAAPSAARFHRPPDLRLVEPGVRPIRVVVADPQGLVRAGFRALLEGEDDIEVAGEAADGAAAFALAAEALPDVMLIDVHLPGLDGVEVTRRIGDDPRLDGVRVVILTASETEEDVFGALRAGASGFLLKDTAPGELVETVRTVAAGGALLSPTVTRRLIAEFAAQPAPDRPRPEQLDELTPRELEVLALVATGMSNAEIAEHLVVSPATAKTHVSRTMCKLRARDRAQLVTLAYESGLVVARRTLAAAA